MGDEKPSAKTYTETERIAAGVYKGYSINWLRKNPEHPDFYLVEEYDQMMADEKEEVAEETPVEPETPETPEAEEDVKAEETPVEPETKE